MSTNPPLERLSRFEKIRVGLFFLVIVIFGGLVEMRTAFLKRRMGDLDCYLRAGWALRVDGNIYEVTSDNGWHYNYPPFYAILMMPLADPPRRDLSLTAVRTIGTASTPNVGPLLATTTLATEKTPLYPDTIGPVVPFAVSAVICYLMNVFFLGLAVHWLASALENVSAHAPKGELPWDARRWWLLRLLPIVACLPPIGHTLMRGQVNLVVLAMIAGLAAGLTNGRRFWAGLALAGAICVKVYPAFLLLVPFWRRDARCLLGCGVGLLGGLVLLPALVMGPRNTLQAYQDYGENLIGPALNLTKDTSRNKELLAVSGTKSQSYRSVLHNTQHPDPHQRPNEMSKPTRLAHWGLGAMFTLITLAVAWRHRNNRSSPAIILAVGAWSTIMVLVTPVCHQHYFVVALPLMMGLLAHDWNQRQWQGRVIGNVTLLVMAVWMIGAVLPLLPTMKPLRDAGLMMYTNMFAWTAACFVLVRMPIEESVAAEGEETYTPPSSRAA